MKPPEILSMIEEATGTSMYESKKESAQRMMEKKENKLTQINKVLLCSFYWRISFCQIFTIKNQTSERFFNFLIVSG